MKRCIKCGQVKSLDQFFKRKGNTDGRRNDCKVCNARRAKAYREANKEKVAANNKAWREANKEKVAANNKAYREANKEKVAAYMAEYGPKYYRANKAKVNARSAAAYAADPVKWAVKTREWARDNPDKMHASTTACRLGPAVPSWYTSEKAAIFSLYAQARMIRDMGGDCEIDHIIPRKHPLVCGLHTLANLQMLPAAENNSKNTTFDPDAHHVPKK